MIGEVSEDKSGSHRAEYPIPTANSQPAGICEGPDKNVWFTEAAAGKIARYVP